MTPDPTLIEQVAAMLAEWGENGCEEVPQDLADRILTTLQGSAALPSEAMLRDELELARQAFKRIEQEPRTPTKMRDIAGARAHYIDIALDRLVARKLNKWVSDTITEGATTPTAPDNMGPQGEERLRETLADAEAMDLADDELLSWVADGQPNLCIGGVRRTVSRLSPTPETDQQRGEIK